MIETLSPIEGEAGSVIVKAEDVVLTKYPLPETIVVAPVTTACQAVPPGLYVLISEAGICFVVVPSITINASASAIVMDEVDFAEPSIKLISEAVAPTPSIMFNSAAVAVTSVPPNLSPFDVSCDAMSKSIAPSDMVTSLSELIEIAGVVPTVDPNPITKSSAESSSPT